MHVAGMFTSPVHLLMVQDWSVRKENTCLGLTSQISGPLRANQFHLVVGWPMVLSSQLKAGATRDGARVEAALASTFANF